MNKTSRSIVLACAALLAGPADAQTLYRCGNNYQDRPCDAGQKGRAFGSTGAAPGVSASAGDPRCAQRGKDALRIVWSREGGATLERVLEEARGAEEKRFVRDVYARPGPASQVQAAVEADCAVEMQKRDNADALAAAAARAQKELGDARETEAPKKVERPREQRAEAEAGHQKGICASLNSRLDSLRVRERAGGSVTTMESLNEERRRLLEDLRRNGC